MHGGRYDEITVEVALAARDSLAAGLQWQWRPGGGAYSKLAR